LRDFVNGGAQGKKPAAKGTTRKTSKRRAAKEPEAAAAPKGQDRSGSLLDRLASVDADGQAGAGKAPENEKPKAKGSWFSFKPGRK
jgi:hypothetical protein